jgi:hypothetical protein
MNGLAINTLVTDKLNELANLKAKMDALSNEVSVERTNQLRQLHSAFGFETPDAFVVAYREANNGTAPAGNGRGRKATRATGNGKKTAKNGNGGRKARVSITPERKKEIIAFFKAGHTTMEAMTKFDIAYATAQNYKKEAGMVNERS